MATLDSRASRWEKFPLLSTLWDWRSHWLELGIYLGFYLVYLLTRGLIFSDPTVALANADAVMALEQSLGIFREPGWQSWAIANAPWLVVLLNWVYIVTYWPVILGMALGLYLFRRTTYRYYRKVIVVNLVLALLIFMLFPLAPPFMAPAYFVDTIQTYGPAFYGSEAMETFYNNTAAMPSLHFSWSLIFGVLFFRSLRGWWRVLGALYPVLACLAIVITGNHYILDAVAGGLLAGVAFAVVEMWRHHRFRSSLGNQE